MNEARVYADGFERSFAEVKDLLEFLAERGRNAKWIRKPTKYVTAGTTGKGGSKSGCGRCIHGRKFWRIQRRIRSLY